MRVFKKFRSFDCNAPLEVEREHYMNTTYYLAVDIGASSGRHILGHIENGKLLLEEIYRFPNGMQKKNGRLVWDADGLFQEIKNGLRACAEAGKIPSFMGIDTWGVDFVLLDANGERLDDAVGYRDARTVGMDLVVSKTLSEEELYARTGIQKQSFNTIYQLAAIREQTPELLEKAETLLMIPFQMKMLSTKPYITHLNQK